ncbi:uncharacterized protein KY384_005184 [Bacidia gigantensis]|uniref:uncharacterized protein n=1 Tax=Bacidia gigantensis TaxID=2732470 RepID=UPI001D041BC7|nr:uncharacterized protein KY384_005184 [Bacidia gigantensis]KAG8529703.1 hypothetical protein KY384_005184 [Bacidia gigantensis]
MMQQSILIPAMLSKVRPEKLLEVWFSASPTALPPSAPAGLKTVPAETWKEMLELVNCKVLSVVESEHVDAYLLSESSMFVFPHKLILKTCGTTTLLTGLPRILEIAATSARFPHNVADYKSGIATAAYPYRVFYSRKNFLFPDRQLGPHRSWRDEVRSLDRLFLGGSAYVIGKLNGEHWYLYLTEPNTMLTPPSTPDRRDNETRNLDLSISRASLSSVEDEDDDDETLEILMTDLDPENAQQFYLDHASAVAEGQFYEKAHEARVDAEQHLGSLLDLPTQNKPVEANGVKDELEEVDIFSNTSSDPCDLTSSHYEQFSYPQELMTEGHSLGTVVSESSGLSDIYPISKYPDARVDAYMFNPCGFSANGVIPAPNGPDATHYFTVHVTPEPNCSYASFETNVPPKQTGRETADVIEQVVKIFKPGRFTVTLFEGKKHVEDDYDETPKKKRAAKKDSRWETIRGYRRIDRIVHDLDGYDLVFKYFEKVDWEGGGLRIGEKDF